MQKQKNYAWVDGRFHQLQHADVPLLNHSLHYGSAAFEGIRAYDTPNGPAVFRLREHVRRLFHSAKVMGMKVPYSQREISDAILKTIAKNKLTECYIRPIISYTDRMGLLPVDLTVSVAIAVWPWGKYHDSDTLKVRIVETRRIHPESGVMTAKVSGHYFNSILAGLEAHKAKADEALLLDHKGNIAEGAGENIFFVNGKTIHTPKPYAILPGITRDTVMCLATERGYKVVEKDIKPTQLKSYDEAFFVGTAVEVHPIAQIDQVKFTSTAADSVSHQLRSAYLDLVRGQSKQHVAWRTLVTK